MIEWKLYVWFGRSESAYKIVSAVVKFMFWIMLSSFRSAALAGQEIFEVLSFNHASEHERSSKVNFISGCSPGGTALSFLHENSTNDNISRK